MYRPLKASEVPFGMIVHLDQQRMTGRRSEVLVECKKCHETRWSPIINIRNGHTKTPYCRKCYLQRGNLSELRPDEAPTADTVLYFDRQELVQEPGGLQKNTLRILGECPDCGKQRWLRVTSIRSGKARSTVCNSCSRKRQPHPLPKMGRQDANGYSMLHVRILTDDDRALAEQYLKLHRKSYVYEHRLVALKIYGPAAAAPGIVIRHLDGNRMNNTPDNLALGSQGDNVMDHMTAVAEMKAWRGLAHLLLRILIDKDVSSQ